MQQFENSTTGQDPVSSCLPCTEKIHHVNLGVVFTKSSHKIPPPSIRDGQNIISNKVNNSHYTLIAQI